MSVPLDKIGPVMRAARRRLHITQAALAEYLETTQSAISMFESGRDHTLALPKVQKAAARLGVDLDTGEILKQEVTPSTARCARYCPNDGCPMNIPFAIGEDLAFLPTFQDGAAAENERCPACATFMHDSCANPNCGAPAVRGRANCPACGACYVVTTFTVRGSASEWAEKRRREIEDLHELTKMNRSGLW